MEVNKDVGDHVQKIRESSLLCLVYKGEKLKLDMEQKRTIL